MSLDLTKPVQTRDGRKVEIISTKGRRVKLILGYIGNDCDLSSWYPTGNAWNDDVERPSDLVNVPEEKWVNVYIRNGNPKDLVLGAVHFCKEEALAQDVVFGNLLATIPLHLYMKD